MMPMLFTRSASVVHSAHIQSVLVSTALMAAEGNDSSHLHSCWSLQQVGRADRLLCSGSRMDFAAECTL